MSTRRLLAVIAIAIVATAAAYELGRQLRVAFHGTSALRQVTFATNQ